MGLEGYRLWVMWQLDSTCRAPPRLTTPTTCRGHPGVAAQVVYLKARFEKPGLVFQGSGFAETTWVPGAFQLWS
jgi:hypothetical protein